MFLSSVNERQQSTVHKELNMNSFNKERQLNHHILIAKKKPRKVRRGSATCLLQTLETFDFLFSFIVSLHHVLHTAECHPFFMRINILRRGFPTIFKECIAK